MRNLLILILVLITNFSYSQKTNHNSLTTPKLTDTVKLADGGCKFVEVELVITENTIVPYGHKKLDCSPEPKDGLESYMKYLKNEFKIPQDHANKSDYKRTIIAQYVIEKDGSLSDVKVIRGNNEQKAEFIRVLQNAPLWKPGMIDNKPVRVGKYSIGLKF